MEDSKMAQVGVIKKEDEIKIASDKKIQEPCNSTSPIIASDDGYLVDLTGVKNADTGGCNFRCGYPGCNKSFNRRWKLNGHLNGHLNIKPFKCDISGCDKCYRTDSHLKRHKKTFHSSPEERAVCELCRKTFGCESSLKAHMVRHSKILKCRYCNMEFKKKSQLVNHENLHRCILPFPCPDCNSQFAKEISLVRHMKTHLIRQCKFTDCDVVGSCVEIRTHMALDHANTVVCDYCSKEFRNKALLRDHIFVHLPSDKRNLIYCSFCPKHYFHKRNLDCHVKNHHSKPRFHCKTSKCNKSFTSQERLDAHIRKNHKVRKTPRFCETIVERLRSTLDDNCAANESSEFSPEEEPASQQPLGQFPLIVMQRDHV